MKFFSVARQLDADELQKSFIVEMYVKKNIHKT